MKIHNIVDTSMKKSNNRLTFLFSGIISFTLSALGFSSCDDLSENGEGPLICMYGVPSANFKVTGKIISEENNKSIRDLQVTLIEYSTWKDGVGNYYENPKGDSLRTKTNENGDFSFEYTGYPSSKKYIYLVEDIDGASNGRFLTKKDSVLFTNPKFTDGSGSWYSGKAEKNLGTIKVKPDTNL